MIYKVAVAGASGYVGGELLRLIAGHPQLELGNVTANSNSGQLLGLHQPHLPGLADRVLLDTTAENLVGHDIVFLALPHAMSAAIAGSLPDSVLVIDCGADFRLENAADWEKFYGGSHAGTWPYGMPELVHADGSKQRKNLAKVSRVAVPGCNVTAITLALAPALQAGLVEPRDIVSILSVGTSGAGKSAKSDLLASEILGSARAYGVGGVHRHTPEIEQNLSKAAGVGVQSSFTPVLVPMARGILAVCTARVVPGTTLESLKAAYQSTYGDESFIQLLPEGQLPTTAAVLGSNNTQLSISLDSAAGRVVVVSAIDNLVKGTAGAAIQSMNLALGIEESLGLSLEGLAP
jgi:N-acetyl-gamma-glutamyl-phosphate reductase